MEKTSNQHLPSFHQKHAVALPLSQTFTHSGKHTHSNTLLMTGLHLSYLCQRLQTGFGLFDQGAQTFSSKAKFHWVLTHKQEKNCLGGKTDYFVPQRF